MNPYECQRSRSFSDTGPRSLGLYGHQHFKISENAGLISIKNAASRRGWGGGFYLNGAGHMTKMAATSIYGIKPKRFWGSFSPVLLG